MHGPKAKEGIKRKLAKGLSQNEVFDAVVSVQQQLLQFHERKEDMQLLMDRSLAVLAHLRKEKIQVTQSNSQPRACHFSAFSFAAAAAKLATAIKVVLSILHYHCVLVLRSYSLAVQYVS